MRLTNKKTIVIALISCLLPGLFTVIYFNIIPCGASPLPFFLASESGGEMTTSKGERCQIVFNDASAAHSGNHWTWVVGRRGMIRRVLAEGYSAPEIRYGEKPLPFDSDTQGDYITFLKSRHGSEKNVKTYITQ